MAEFMRGGLLRPQPKWFDSLKLDDSAPAPRPVGKFHLMGAQADLFKPTASFLNTLPEGKADPVIDVPIEGPSQPTERQRLEDQLNDIDNPKPIGWKGKLAQALATVAPTVIGGIFGGSAGAAGAASATNDFNDQQRLQTEKRRNGLMDQIEREKAREIQARQRAEDIAYRSQASADENANRDRSFKEQVRQFNESQKSAGQFNLGPGQARYDASGNLLASMPEKSAPVSLGPGETLIDPKNGKVIGSGGQKAPQIHPVVLDIGGKPVPGIQTINADGSSKTFVGSQEIPNPRVFERAPANYPGNDQALVDSVIENPELFNQLSSKTRERIAPSLQARGFRDFGRTPGNAAIERIADYDTSLQLLDDLERTLVENPGNIGPIDQLQAFIPGSDAQKIGAQIATAKQIIGKALEGGVLRKEDEAKYEKILPRLGDTEAVAQSKINNVRRLVERGRANFISNQGNTGYRSAPKNGNSSGGSGRPSLSNFER